MRSLIGPLYPSMINDNTRWRDLRNCRSWTFCVPQWIHSSQNDTHDDDTHFLLEAFNVLLPMALGSAGGYAILLEDCAFLRQLKWWQGGGARAFGVFVRYMSSHVWACDACWCQHFSTERSSCRNLLLLSCLVLHLPCCSPASIDLQLRFDFIIQVSIISGLFKNKIIDQAISIRKS